MKYYKLIFLILFFSSFILSCRYVRPFPSLKTHQHVFIDSLSSEKKVRKKFVYFSLRHCILIDKCTISYDYDSSGILIKKEIIKRYPVRDEIIHKYRREVHKTISYNPVEKSKIIVCTLSKGGISWAFDIKKTITIQNRKKTKNIEKNKSW